jgi:hypothetical protein
MRKSILAGWLCLSITTILLISCRKEASQGLPDSNDEMISKVNSWFDNQKISSQPNKSSNIELLKNNLDFSGLRIEEYDKGEKIIIVPVKDEFKKTRQIDNNKIPNLVLIFDKSGNIRKGNLVLYIPKNGEAVTKVLDNTFYNIFNTATPECNGQFRFLTVDGIRLYQLDYNNERLASVGVIKKGNSSNTVLTETGCTDWYLITTYYYTDGTTSQTSVYLGRTCEGSGGGSYDCINTECLDPGNNSGALIEYEYAVTREVPWEVYKENMSGPAATITGQVQFFGKKVSTEPQGGHFTQSNDHGTFTLNFSTYGMDWVGVYTQSWHGTQNGYQSVQGNITYGTYGPPPKYISPTKNFQFAEVFP